MAKAKGNDPSRFGTIIEGKHGAIAQIQSKHGATHAYSLEEVSTFARIINHLLKDDPDCQDRLPMNAEDSESLFHAMDNGILLCKVCLLIDPDCLDARALNRGQQMTVFQIKENLQMGIAAAKGLGIKLIGINS